MTRTLAKTNQPFYPHAYAHDMDVVYERMVERIARVRSMMVMNREDAIMGEFAIAELIKITNEELGNLVEAYRGDKDKLDQIDPSSLSDALFEGKLRDRRASKRSYTVNGPTGHAHF